jgi:N utilization substance protein A
MLNLKEFISAIDQIAEEKGIEKERVQEVIELALAAAYKKDYGEKGQNIKVVLDPKSGTAKFFQSYLVVTPEMVLTEEELAELEEGEEFPEHREEEVVGEGEERKVRFNAKRHMYLPDAKEIKQDVVPGEELLIPLEEKEDFGRIAAQTAKQVIIQRIREAERAAVYEAFKGREGEIVSGSVQRIDRGVVYLDIGRTTGVLFPDEQIPQERYRASQRVRVYVVRVEKDTKGPVIVLSRKHPGIVAKLFELEVPEIGSGAVEIRQIAREAGSRTKIAVTSHEEGIDPVGSCVGQKGIRVSAVINELGGENIDIIAWDEDPGKFIANALSPAKVLNVELNESEHVAYVDVRDDQLSLAIGRRGQNVRLAAKLTGWKIEVRGAEKVVEKDGVTKEAVAGEEEQIKDENEK